ncbi:MAG: hypothetical protein AAGA91_16275 [Pseudomonadota bacterium]
MLFIACSISALATSVLVQERMSMLQKRLSLSEEQVTKMTPIVADHLQAMETIKQEYGIGASEGGFEKLPLGKKVQLGKALEQANVKANTQLEDILTVTQMREYQQVRTEDRQKLLNNLPTTP